MRIDASELSGRHAYHLMTTLVVPRPVAWVGTRSADGRDNLAPFSYFMGVGSRPPSIAISVARKRLSGGGFALKDTARNVLDTGVFTVSIVSRELGPAMAVTGADWPDSEFERAGLEPVPGDLVAAPRPAGARAAMECRLLRAVDLETTHLLVGEVLCFHLADDLVVRGADDNPLVDVRALGPICRLGGNEYAALGEFFELRVPRPER